MQSLHPPTRQHRLRIAATLLIAPLLLALLFTACGGADDTTGITATLSPTALRIAWKFAASRSREISTQQRIGPLIPSAP